jgi:hypothetical protein
MQGPAERGAGGEEALEWTVIPWKREPRKSLLVLLVVAAAVAGSWWFSGRQIFFALLALLILWGSLGPYFVKTRFVIDSEGVEVDSPFLKRRRRWGEFKSYYVDRHGATLSPFSGRSPLEAYRSVRVLFGDREAQVRARVREKLGEPAHS